MAEMKHLQSRIHTLRGAMNRENHPQYELATRTKTSATWDFANHPKGARFPKDAKDCKLILAPRDSEFGDLLAKAGIIVTNAARDVLEEIAAPSTPSDPSIESTPESDQPNPYRTFIK